MNNKIKLSHVRAKSSMKEKATEEQNLSNRWAILEHNATWIQSADNKATALLAIEGIVISFLLSSAFELSRNGSSFSILTALGCSSIWLFAGVVALLAGVASTLFCLMGRTGLRGVSNSYLEERVFRPQNTLIFFGKIAQHSQGKYVELLNDSDTSELLNDLACQIHVLSRIATEKYLWIHRAYLCLAVAVGVFLVLGILVIL
jgi:hypothetical protein